MVIIGAGGLAKEILATLLWTRPDADVALFDDVSPSSPRELLGFPVLRTWEELQAHWRRVGTETVIGVGASAARQMLGARIVEAGGRLGTLISNHALVAGFGVTVAEGVCILPYAMVMPDVSIGAGCLVNKGASLSHDTTIGRYCSIAPGARILGGASVGDGAEIGANATVLSRVKVGAGSRVGAGAVVFKDVADGATVVGNPAEPIGAALRRRRRG